MTAPVAFWEALEGDARAEWEMAFEERAAIMEYDGGLDRRTANREAYVIVREQWRKET